MKMSENERSVGKIWIVTGNFYKGEPARGLCAAVFPEAQVSVFYRDYHFKGAVSQGNVPDLLLSDGTCKIRPDWDPIEPVMIKYDKPEEYAKEHGRPIIFFERRGVFDDEEFSKLEKSLREHSS